MCYISYVLALIPCHVFDYRYNITIFITLYWHINIISGLNKRQVNSNGFVVDSEQ